MCVSEKTRIAQLLCSPYTCIQTYIHICIQTYMHADIRVSGHENMGSNRSTCSFWQNTTNIHKYNKYTQIEQNIRTLLKATEQWLRAQMLDIDALQLPTGDGPPGILEDPILAIDRGREADRQALH